MKRRRVLFNLARKYDLTQWHYRASLILLDINGLLCAARFLRACRKKQFLPAPR